MIIAIEELLTHDVAGDPITGVRWTRRTTEKISEQLRVLDIDVNFPRFCGRFVKPLFEGSWFGFRIQLDSGIRAWNATGTDCTSTQYN